MADNRATSPARADRCPQRRCPCQCRMVPVPGGRSRLPSTFDPTDDSSSASLVPSGSWNASAAGPCIRSAATVQHLTTGFSGGPQVSAGIVRRAPHGDPNPSSRPPPRLCLPADPTGPRVELPRTDPRDPLDFDPERDLDSPPGRGHAPGCGRRCSRATDRCGATGTRRRLANGRSGDPRTRDRVDRTRGDGEADDPARHRRFTHPRIDGLDLGPCPRPRRHLRRLRPRRCSSRGPARLEAGTPPGRTTRRRRASPRVRADDPARRETYDSAQKAKRAGHYDEARSLFEAVVASAPESGDSLRSLAEDELRYGLPVFEAQRSVLMLGPLEPARSAAGTRSIPLPRGKPLPPDPGRESLRSGAGLRGPAGPRSAARDERGPRQRDASDDARARAIDEDHDARVLHDGGELPRSGPIGGAHRPHADRSADRRAPWRRASGEASIGSRMPTVATPSTCVATTRASRSSSRSAMREDPPPLFAESR